MNISPFCAGPKLVSRAVSFLAAIALLVSAGAACGQNVIRVEEDWELRIGEPDFNSVGPQVLTTMSPICDLTDVHFTLEINHRSAPTWSPGGISIHRWTGEVREASYDRADRTIMNTGSEVVTWTQALYKDVGGLHYKVYNGVSSTWGAFGFSNLLKLDTNWGGSHLDDYTPAVSVAQSGAPYAGNRVQLLKIKQIRVTLSDLSVLTDTTERIVHELVE